MNFQVGNGRKTALASVIALRTDGTVSIPQHCGAHLT